MLFSIYPFQDVRKWKKERERKKKGKTDKYNK